MALCDPGHAQRHSSTRRSAADPPTSGAAVPHAGTRSRSDRTSFVDGLAANRLRRLRLDTPIDLQLWRVSLDEPAPGQELLAWLDDTELRRAAAFRFAHLARRYLWAKVALRILLARSLACSPHHVAIRTTSNGRPFVDGVADLAFSLSHTSDLAAIAITRSTAAIGVDIEAIDDSSYGPCPGQASLEAMVCTPRERDDLPPSAPERAHAFFGLWTCKEACLKALGTGLLTDPRRYDVDLTQRTHPQLRAWPDGGRFSILTFTPHPGTAGAVAFLQDRISPASPRHSGAGRESKS